MKSQTSYKIKRIGISDQIADIMKKKIISHEWSAGEKIPSETELSKQFGVSRLSARTALQRLSALGLIEIRVGDGTYIPEYPLDNFFDEGSELLMTIQMKDSMGEFRELFEQSYMVLACARRTEHDIQKVTAIWEQMEIAANNASFNGYMKYDIEFHRTMCKISRNQYFILVYKLMEKSLIAHYRENTMACSKLKNMSTNKDDKNYYLKQLVIGHHNYIKALEKQDFSIAVHYLNPYIDAYKENRHAKK